jgi:hypothetical protein
VAGQLVARLKRALGDSRTEVARDLHRQVDST